MYDSTQGVAMAILFAALLVPIQSLAQEQDEGESVRSSRLGLLVPLDLRREKRRAAKRGEWAWTLAAAAAAGYDSNLHLSPSDREDTAVFEAALRGEVLHYFNRDSRLRIRAQVDAIPYTASSDADDYRQKVSIFYAHRITDDFKLFMGGKVEHKNDSVTNVLGDSLERDFESWNYRIRPTVAYRIDRVHRFRLQYPAKRKDYAETSTLDNSLDWWSHGPRLSYNWGIRDDLTLGLSYAFKTQNYDAEPATLRNGNELTSNPNEKHFFHRVQADVSWETRDWLEFTLDLGWKRKDDRFQDYESYDKFDAGMAAKMAIAGFLITTKLEYQHRDYDNRPEHPADGSGELSFDRIDFGLAARTQLTPSFGVFGGYGLRWRHTNRSKSEASSYLSHTAHSLMAGVSWAL